MSMIMDSEVTTYPMLMSVAFILWWGPQSIDFVNALNFMACGHMS